VNGAHSDAGPTRVAIRQAVSVSIATGLYGISFGALAVAAGLSVWQAQILSMVMFTGGSQFALVGVLGAGGLGSAAVASAALLGGRNLLYAVQLGPLLGLSGWRRLLGAQLTIDESTAVALAQPSPRARRVGFWWTGAGVWICWNALTLLGALAGDAMGDPRAWGLDAAAAAAFLGLLWPRLAPRQAQATAVLAVATALATTPWLTPGVPVLLAALAALAVGFWPPRRRAGDAIPRDDADLSSPSQTSQTTPGAQRQTTKAVSGAGMPAQPTADGLRGDCGGGRHRTLGTKTGTSRSLADASGADGIGRWERRRDVSGRD
jgi:predicted branched-subunit amino acid permease